MKLIDAGDGSFRIDSPEEVQRILVIRQHNQLGDLLASSCVFKALKETYPRSHLTVVVSPANKDAVTNNPFIDKVYVFNKKQLHLPYCMMNLLSVLNRKYDLAFVPFTVSISYTSNLLAKMSRSRYRFGVASLEGKDNKQAQWFDKAVALDWRNDALRHISERSADFFRYFGVQFSSMDAVIVPAAEEKKSAAEFIAQYGLQADKLIGLHCGAGKIPNRWPAQNFAEVITALKNKGYSVYLTASSADADVTDAVQARCTERLPVFLNRSLGEVAAVISLSKLFITNDTGIMHTAGATETPQISLFGPTPAEVWGPRGKGKINLKSGDDISLITVEEVLSTAFTLTEQTD